MNRYKQWIKTWELWNEPDIDSYWRGASEEFARFVKIGSKPSDRPTLKQKPGMKTTPNCDSYNFSPKAPALRLIPLKNISALTLCLRKFNYLFAVIFQGNMYFPRE
ncbi:MAG: hypothetical protein ACM3RX_00745 [Methanococcaceae archaeon]